MQREEETDKREEKQSLPLLCRRLSLCRGFRPSCNPALRLPRCHCTCNLLPALLQSRFNSAYLLLHARGNLSAQTLASLTSETDATPFSASSHFFTLSAESVTDLKL